MERSGVEIHDYQEHQTRAQAMRKMDGCSLIDILELPSKGLNYFCKAARHAVSKGIGPYLSKFLLPFQSVKIEYLTLINIIRDC